jgi:hypothetical protein
VRHAPDAILIRDEDVSLAPGEAVRRIETFGMSFNPSGRAVLALA